MNWLDIAVFVIVGGIAIWEMTRGFGRAVLDALALFGALWVADALSLPIAHGLSLSPHPTINHGLAYGLLLLVFGAVLLVLSRFVYGMTQMHMGMFEGLFGLVAGVAAGMMAAHGLVRLIAMSDWTGQAGHMVADSFMGNEMMSFTTYHSVLNTLYSATAPRQVTDVSR